MFLKSPSSDVEHARINKLIKNSNFNSPVKLHVLSRNISFKTTIFVFQIQYGDEENEVETIRETAL